MRRTIGTVVLGLVAAVLPGLVTAGASAATCAVTWGSLPRTTAYAPSPGDVVGVRTGRHTCFDRLVVDLSGPARGYRVRYVTTVYADPSGAAVPLRGGARLQVVVDAPAYDDAGRPTYRPADRRELTDVTGYRTFRQVAWAGSFEGQTQLGLGVRARLPFRVLVLGDRLVVDVAHTW